MTIKLRVDSLDSIPEAMRGSYVKDGATFVLDLENRNEITGAQAKVVDLSGKLDAFRGSNRTMLQALKDLGLADADANVSPDKLEQLKKTMEMLGAHEDAEDLKKGADGINNVIKRRTERVVRDAEDKVKAALTKETKATETAAALKQRYDRLLVQTRITSALNGAGVVQEGALPDALGRAQNTWRVGENDELYAVDDQGRKMVNPKGEPTAPEEWTAGLVKTAPHLFVQSGGGGGARPGNQGARQGQQGGTQWIDPDPVLLGRHAEDILKGTVKVRPMAIDNQSH